MVVYVLTEVDIDTKIERPVGVVSEEMVADQFYQQNTRDRDYIPFNLDEVPMLSGTPATEIPEHPAEKALREQNETLQQVNDLNREHADVAKENQRLMQEIMRYTQRRRK